LGQKKVQKKLFLDHRVPEATVGRFTGGILGQFGSSMATPLVSDESTMLDYRFSRATRIVPVLILGIA
jgi:hypothetical protein